jgi:multicomponent Na+:H+ antiporter subunit B
MVLCLLIALALGLLPLLVQWAPPEGLSGVAHHYASEGPGTLGAANLVTAIIVTYRGLDTLGEVSVLFLAATGIAVLLRFPKKREEEQPKRPSSEILQTGARLIAPVMLMFGGYIFVNGHLSPGGGFQGGAVVATTVLLLMLADPSFRANHALLSAIESLSGFAYVLTGALGLFLAGGFLDNRFLGLGEWGHILSAGAIPVIYTLVGLKVGTELAALLGHMQRELS